MAGPGGDRAFWHHPGANRAFDGAAVDLAGAEALHVGYPALIGAGLDRGGRPLRDLLSRAAAGGVLTSLDTTTLDAQSPAAALDWTARLRLWLPVTDVFSPSADDLRSMLPEFRDATPAELAEAAIAWGAAVAAVSAGPAGLALACGPAERLARAGGPLRHLAPAWADARLAVPAAPLDRIVSTNGAGDTMSAGLLHGIGLGLAPAAAASLAARAAAARIQGRPLPHR
ncbi:MAG: PfkB family carbohydrate kinase [Bifidobacteriaceae bacterium]|nr:PfkB family carbohydrate kinase [Bifidobacteriaceae bacterium]